MSETTTRDPNPEEVAAMWLFGTVYANQNLGIVDWYATQGERVHTLAREFVAEMRAALERAP